MVDDAVGAVAWAKSVRDEFGVVTDWLPLFQHLDDTTAVAGLLLDCWVSPQVKARIGQELPGEETDLPAVVCWLAGTHDVG
ncbi:HD domain-containing protein [Amycolatopsis sp. NPDC004169]|uniref:HD domain-containing protein n=1 Tax=Amycolatopsis sp. NPDC004169 TaxID=3154453 RepID=UPI0033AFAC03